MKMLLCSLLLCIFTQVCCQLCGGPCRCAPSPPGCPAGVPLVPDGCGCCQVCARQEGEACTQRLPCDHQRGLQCDYSASFPDGPGQCVGVNGLGCELAGMKLEEGQVFQPSCALLCRCLGGGLTCVPLCSDGLRAFSDTQCPNPQLVRLPGQCCKEWVCEGLDNTISSSLAGAVQRRHHHGGGLSVPPFGSTSNCIEWSSAWTPCSRSCGPGVSVRSTNRNRACRLQTETRLCQVRPCQAVQQAAEAGVCESSYSPPVSVHLELQGCWSSRTYRPRFCALACPGGHCCSPAHTRTAEVLFLCPGGRLSLQQVMMIQSCSCSALACPPTHTLPRL